MPRRRTLVVSLAVACALVTTAALVPRAAGADPAGDVSDAASVTERTSRTPIAGEVVSINQFGELSDGLRDKAQAVARAVNAPSVLGRGFTIGLHAVHRGSATVQEAVGPGGLWQYPLNVTALPVDAIGRIFGFQVSSLVAQGLVVMGRTSADLRGAQAGDTVDLVAADGGIRTFTIGAVVDDDEVGGTEIVMSLEQADVIGATIVTRVVIFGSFERGALDEALAAQGLVDGYGVRISKSWNPANPDGLLGLARTKAALGEFSFRVNSFNSMTMDQAWVDANIVRRNFQFIGVRAYCHRLIADDLQAALREVYEAGLSWAIDLANTNTYGGCWNPRYARASANIGSVSRHAWGMAFDTNTTQNAQGSTPRMDCRVVRIFRKHNFAWGGNFLLPDGMHFEWVGEPRNTWAYPSKYCPNLSDGRIESAFRVTPTESATMFASDDSTPVVEP
ncbi:MAG: M15 family metallopeptidase [Ilumatobacteraceae bacterium]